MTERRFVDDQGTRWAVRDTVPSMAERRQRVRRRRGGAEDDGTVSHPTTPAERRHHPERRQVSETRASVSPGHENGWLTFECAAGKRRLAPIPEAWDALPEAELRALCARAVAVPRWRGRLIE